MILWNLFKYSSFYHYAWGNDLLSHKLQELKNYPDVNAIFLGSSHIYNQVNPHYLDSITECTVSYNLGSPGLSSPENYYLLEHLLQDNNYNLDLIVLDFSTLQATDFRNFFKPQTSYFLDFENLKYALKIVSQEKYLNIKTRFFRGTSFVTNYIYKLIGLPFVINFFDKKSEKINLTQMQLGFLPLENDKTDLAVRRRATFLKNGKKQLRDRTYQISKQFQEVDIGEYDYKSHFNRLEKIFKSAEEKGINLFILLTPRKKNNQEFILLQEKFDSNKFIEIANPNEYPELYEFENSFDIGHLNAKGSAIFTRVLATRLKSNFCQ